MLAEQYRQQQERLDRRAALAALLQVYHPGLGAPPPDPRQGQPFTLEELVSLLDHGFQRPPAPPPRPSSADLAAKLADLAAASRANGARVSGGKRG